MMTRDLPLKAVDAAAVAAALRRCAKGLQACARRPVCPRKENVIVMKKSYFAAVLLFLAAAVGALTAGYLYIRRREKELDEYESLLFSEDFDDEPAEDEPAADEPAAE